MKSFRYQDLSDTPPGLKCLVLNGNVELGDRGLQRIAVDLKDDEWIKAIELQNCGLTDAGGSAVVDCLKCNKTLTVFDVNYNPKMSRRVFNEIQKMLGADPDTLEVDRKESTIKLRETIDLLEQRLEIETANREQAHKMNVQLHNKLRKANELKMKQEVEIPSGYLLINEDILKTLHEQLEDLKQGKRGRRNEGDHSKAIELRNRMSEQSIFGDQLQAAEINQEMSRRIQLECTDERNANRAEASNVVEDQSISEDETSLFKAKKGKMKSVYTMLSDPITSGNDEATYSD